MPGRNATLKTGTMANLLFLDLSPEWNGWCIGRGRQTPLADAFQLPKCGDDLAALGEAFENHVELLIRNHHPVAIGYESPLLRKHDKLMTLRRTYGLGFFLEQIARRHGIDRKEVDVRKVKQAMTGDSFAEKKHMIAAAISYGIDLPKSGEGRDDAADAAGGAFELMAEFDPDAHAYWQSRVSQRNGALL